VYEAETAKSTILVLREDFVAGYVAFDIDILFSFCVGISFIILLKGRNDAGGKDPRSPSGESALHNIIYNSNQPQRFHLGLALLHCDDPSRCRTRAAKNHGCSRHDPPMLRLRVGVKA